MNSQVLFRCDNSAVVEVINNRSAKDPRLAHMVRCLFFFAASHRFTFSAEHVPGVENGLADALSRKRYDLFVSRSPQVPPPPILVPPPLCSLLFNKPIKWTSLCWRRQFADLCGRSLREHLSYLHVQKETICQLLLPICFQYGLPVVPPSETTLLFVCGISSSCR